MRQNPQTSPSSRMGPTWVIFAASPVDRPTRAKRRLPRSSGATGIGSAISRSRRGPMLQIIAPRVGGQANYLSLDRTARLAHENAIMRYVESVVDVWAERSLVLPDPRRCAEYEEEFLCFRTFAKAINVGSLPASGHTVALYLLDRLYHGAHPDELASAAAAVAHAHEMAERYLDWAPIHAALNFAIKDADDAHPDNTRAR